MVCEASVRGITNVEQPVHYILKTSTPTLAVCCVLHMPQALLGVLVRGAAKD